jgi:hypothetical protein
MRGRIARLIFWTDLQGVRSLLALAELMWAMALAMPGDTFERPTYTVMSMVAGEDVWMLMFLLTGVIQLYLLLQWRVHSGFSKYFAFWNSTLWWFVVISMYLSVWPIPAAISGELALAVGASWVFVRSGYYIHGRRGRDGE